MYQIGMQDPPYKHPSPRALGGTRGLVTHLYRLMAGSRVRGLTSAIRRARACRMRRWIGYLTPKYSSKDAEPRPARRAFAVDEIVVAQVNAQRDDPRHGS